MRKKRGMLPAALLAGMLLSGLPLPVSAAALPETGGLIPEDASVPETEAQSQAEPVFEEVLDPVLAETAEEEETADYVSDEEAVEIQMELAREGSLEELLNQFENLGIICVGSGYLNVREDPDADGTVVGKTVDKDVCDVLGTEGDWVRICSGPVEGYVFREFVVTGDEAVSLAFAAMDHPTVTVSTDTLNVRTEPREDAEVLDRLDENESYDVIESRGDWIEIELDTDSTGFVFANYVSLGYTLGRAIAYEDPRETIRQEIVDYAMQFIGNPYRWGGESLTNGCDCSGFTMLVYRHFGISLEHHSASQAGRGRRVTAEEMQPGDLIFYSGGGGINHVTMYIGGGKCIGAQSSRTGIQVRSWTYRTPVRIVSILD